MNPVGVELDAAVLRILGFNPSHSICGNLVYVKRGQLFKLGVDELSTDHNGHEALRLCGPWLDEHCGQWSIESHTTRGNCRKWFFADANLIDSAKYIALDSMATRAEAIARLVLAIAEQEGT